VTASPDANGSEPFDLSTAEAAAVAEAEGHPFAFTYADRRYEVPNQGTWPLKTLHRFEEGDLEGTLAELLDQKVYDQLREDGLRVAGINRLFTAMTAQQMGMSLPNSARRQRPATTRTPKRR
jgi:hypothetical protein